MNQLQPRPKDQIDEKTIDENLKRMDYPANEDILYQNKEVDAPNLGQVNKQVSTADELLEQSK